MPTFDELIARVRQQLLGYAKDQTSVSELAAPMGASDTSFTVDTATVDNISRGLVEIDDELILVKTFDRTTGVVTVMGLTNGRGREGSVAATHSTNALVTTSPMFPRLRIKEAINDAIEGLYPDLVIFGSTEVTKLAPVFEYGIPTDVKDIWYVTGQLIGPTKIWQPLVNWRYNPSADPGDFPTGKSIQVMDYVHPGQGIRVVYAKEPATLSGGSDDFATVTGYPSRIAELVIWGACAQLIPAYEAARLQQVAIEPTERAALVPPQSAVRSAAYFDGMYRQRLQEERRRMFEEVPQYFRYQAS